MISSTVPLETLDPDTVETYYKDSNALFSVTIDEDKMINAVQTIREIIGEDNDMTGSAVTTAVATTTTVSEVARAAGMAVLFVLFVLILTTTSYAELSQELHKLPQVKSILSYVDTVGETIPEQYLDSATPLAAGLSARQGHPVLSGDRSVCPARASVSV